MTTKALTPRKQMENLLSTRDKVISTHLRGTQLDSEKFRLGVLSQLDQTPALLTCRRESVLMSAYLAAQQGLEFVGGQAYLIPFKGEAKLIVGYKGYVELLYGTGKVKSINAKCVYQGEEFGYDQGTNEISHPFSFDTDRSDENIVGAYAVIETVSGGRIVEVLSRDELERIRNSSRGKNSDAYRQWLPEMYKKACILRAAKKGPKSRALNVVIEAEDRAEKGLSTADLVEERDEDWTEPEFRDVGPTEEPTVNDDDIP